MARWWGDMMDDEKPCCAASAARKIKKVLIGGQEIGIAQLDEAIERVAALDLGDGEAICRALLKEVMIYNYVPASRALDYQRAIMEEYTRRKPNGH